MDGITEALSYWWRRWTRGLGLLALVGMTLVAAVLMVGLPMTIIGEVTGRAAWQSWPNIVLVAVVAVIPFFLTRQFPAAAEQLFADQKADEQRRRRRSR
ncbi:cytochrome bd-type quinol oxidase subunit 2 [Sphingobium xenophagum]|uniref:Cytochrome bd-type quinol oxidase subunit 2 n=1 Tax=Sphingobium xenophagum TaxID=121428 RepID=A0ABU1X1C1_SPHXE|nr:hypothetical protein [Sphingobium xenophagum]MDR7155361.1 cytochrome bd-type quinol oxidase subunit 2 [Sphingobium xenophagum]